MTIEGKAKAYDEALNIAKETYETQPMYRAWLEKMFPELAESEDEMIRQGIVETIKQCTDMLDPKNQKRMLAYLEKQKDHFRDDTKMVEQKSAENGVDVIKTSALLAADRLASAEMTGRLKERSEILENPEEYGLHKPAEWSEEDEDIRDTIIHDLKRLGGDIANVKPAYKKEIDWLKSLRPQPNLSWSDEDEKVYNKALDALYYKDLNNKDDVLSALKGLCDLISKKRKVIPPYSRWKPSKAQKEAVQRAIDCLDGEYNDHPEELDSLLKDLEKLM